MFEIKVGLEQNLDVSLYAKTDYNEHQMKDILWGLQDGLDVSIYVKKFNREQMWQIRIGLKANLDVSQYAKVEYNWKEMKEIRKRLENEKNI